MVLRSRRRCVYLVKIVFGVDPLFSGVNLTFAGHDLKLSDKEKKISKKIEGDLKEEVLVLATI